MAYQDYLEEKKTGSEKQIFSCAAMVELILLLISLGIAVSVENPFSRLFWLTSFMVKLFERFPDKKSELWSYNPKQPHVSFLTSLGLMCDQSHQHDS